MTRCPNRAAVKAAWAPHAMFRGMIRDIFGVVVTIVRICLVWYARMLRTHSRHAVTN